MSVTNRIRFKEVAMLTVKNLAIGQFANVTHADFVALFACWTFTNFLVVNFDALDSPRASGFGSRRFGCLSRAGWALFEVLSELNLLVALDRHTVFGFFGSLRSCSFAIVLLQLLQLLLAKLRLIIRLQRLSHDIIKGVTILKIISRALVLALLILGLDKCWCFIILAINFSDAGVLQSVQIVTLLIIKIKLKFILIRRQVIIPFRVGIRIVNLVMVVVSVIIRDNVVSGQVNGVGARNFEEDTLILGDSNIERLLVILYAC